MVVDGDVVVFKTPPAPEYPEGLFGSTSLIRIVDPELPRGSVIGGVGVLTQSYGQLHVFNPFLTAHAKSYARFLHADGVARRQEREESRRRGRRDRDRDRDDDDDEDDDDGGRGKEDDEDDDIDVDDGDDAVDHVDDDGGKSVVWEGEALVGELEVYLATLLGEFEDDDKEDGDGGVAGSSSQGPLGGVDEDLVWRQTVLHATHPVASFENFVRFLGPSVFVLWKALLLRKSILFFSPPPIEIVCTRVYHSCLLVHHDIPLSFDMGLNPMFFVSVADLPMLDDLRASHTPYIACTTESIYADKTSVYDVYVNNKMVVIPDPDLKEAIALTASDRERFRFLITSANSGTLDSMAQAIRRINNMLLRQVAALAPPASGSVMQVANAPVIPASDLPETLCPKDAPFVRAFSHVHEIPLNVLDPSGGCASCLS